MSVQSLESELSEVERRIEKTKAELKSLRRLRVSLIRALEEAKKLA